jgi:HAD superfamily hydrolase (TIGR01509 family)
MDGTLVNTEPYWLEAETELLANFGYKWTLEDQKQCLGGPLTRVGEYMCQKARNQTPEYFIQELISLVARKVQTNLQFMPGALEMIEQIRNRKIPMGLVSASPRVLVDSALNLIGENTFLVSISSDDVSKTKPDPEPYLVAAAKIGVEISHSLIFEDSRTGILSAQASGALVVAIPHIVEIEESERTVVVDSLLGYSFDDLAYELIGRVDNDRK